jgi:hypothetical protein
MLFTTACQEDRGTTTEVVDANEDENVDPNHIRGFEEGPVNSNRDLSASYDAEAGQISSRMADDMSLDEATRTKVNEVYANSAKEMDKLNQEYHASATARTGGEPDNDTKGDVKTGGNDAEVGGTVATASTMSDADMKAARTRISNETNRQLKAILTPEQYQQYIQNHDKYEIKYENEATDTKMKVDGDETKYKQGDTKIKTEGDEMKVKTDDVKMKVEEKD